MILVWLVPGCATPGKEGPDLQLKAAAEAAQVAFQRGDVKRAEPLYAKALARARLTDNRDEMVRNAYNLALCLMISGQLDEARSLLAQARMLAAERGVVAARILLAEAEVARLAGDDPGSEQLARQALAAGVDREGKVQAWLLQGEAWLHRGQLQSSLECYRSAKKQITSETPASIRARLDDLESGLVQGRRVSGSVPELQQSRAEWLKKAGQFNEMVKALQSAAKAWELESKWAEAFDCRIRAARSLQAAGTIDLALIEARLADELAGRTGNAKDKAMVANLMGELK